VPPRIRIPAGDPFCHVHDPLEFSIADARALTVTSGPMVALEAWQEGRCALCGGEVPLRWMVADHCHDGGWVRGLLCMGCNALEAHGPRRARDLRQGRALAGYLSLPPTTMLGLRVRYRDVDGWKRACEARYQAAHDAREADLAAQAARMAARVAVDARSVTSRS
jgi:hypothetical protein